MPSRQQDRWQLHLQTAVLKFEHSAILMLEGYRLHCWMLDFRVLGFGFRESSHVVATQNPSRTGTSDSTSRRRRVGENRQANIRLLEHRLISQPPPIAPNLGKPYHACLHSPHPEPARAPPPSLWIGPATSHRLQAHPELAVEIIAGENQELSELATARFKDPQTPEFSHTLALGRSRVAH
jgi:hypothetical protein